MHSADAKLLSQATNRWALQGWQTQWVDTAKAQGTIALGALQPYVANSHEQGYALVNNGQQQGELLQSVTTELQYDAFGNALQILSRTEDGSGTEVQRQTTSDIKDTHKFVPINLLAKPKKAITATKCVPVMRCRAGRCKPIP